MPEAKPMSALRCRMIDDMTLRGFGPSTQRSYIGAVRRCAAHVRKPPGDLGAEDARVFLLHLQARGASAASVNNHSAAAALLPARDAGAAGAYGAHSGPARGQAPAHGADADRVAHKNEAG